LFSAWEAGHSLGSAAASLWPKKGFLSQAARAGALLDYRFLRLVCVIVHLGDFRGDYRFLRLVCVIVHLGDFRGGGCNCT